MGEVVELVAVLGERLGDRGMRLIDETMDRLVEEHASARIAFPVSAIYLLLLVTVRSTVRCYPGWLRAGSLTTSSASGSHTSAGWSACASLRRSRTNAGAPRNAGISSWKSR